MLLSNKSARLTLLGGVLLSVLFPDASTAQTEVRDDAFQGSMDPIKAAPWHGTDGPLMNRFGQPWRPERQLAIELPKLAKPAPMQVFLPFGEDWVPVELEPYSIRTVDFRLLERGADGTVRQVSAPPSRLYRGEILDRLGSEVLAVIDEAGTLSARLETHEELWLIQPLARYVPGASGEQHVVYSGRNSAISSRAGEVVSTLSPAKSRSQRPGPSTPAGSLGRSSISRDPANKRSLDMRSSASHGRSAAASFGQAANRSPLPLSIPSLSLGAPPLLGSGPLPSSGGAGPGKGDAQFASLSYRAGAVACYVDNFYYQWAGNSTSAVVNDIELLYAQVSSEYDDNGVNPFKFNFAGALYEVAPGSLYPATSAGSLLAEFFNDWDASDYYGFDVDFCQLLTGKDLGPLLGEAYFDDVCQSSPAMSVCETNFSGSLKNRGWLSGAGFAVNFGAEFLDTGLFGACTGDPCQFMCPIIPALCPGIGISWAGSTADEINDATALSCFDPAVGTHYAKASLEGGYDPIPYPDGTSSLPWSSVAQALGFMESGDTLILYGDVYSESVLYLDQPATIRAIEGSATIQ